MCPPPPPTPGAPWYPRTPLRTRVIQHTFMSHYSTNVMESLSQGRKYYKGYIIDVCLRFIWSSAHTLTYCIFRATTFIKNISERTIAYWVSLHVKKFSSEPQFMRRISALSLSSWERVLHWVSIMRRSSALSLNSWEELLYWVSIMWRSSALSLNHEKKFCTESQFMRGSSARILIHEREICTKSHF